MPRDATRGGAGARGRGRSSSRGGRGAAEARRPSFSSRVSPPPPPVGKRTAASDDAGSGSGGSDPTAKIESLGSRLIPEETAKQYRDLSTKRSPASLQEATQLVSELQAALDHSTRQFRRFQESCVEISRESAGALAIALKGQQEAATREKSALAANMNDQIEGLTTTLSTVNLDKRDAVSAVEKRWRAILNESDAKHRNEVESLRRKCDAKEEEAAQLLYVNMANERRISELTTQISSATASQKVGEGDSKRRDAEVERLVNENSRLQVSELAHEGRVVLTGGW